ncbi:SAM-dependent methyltransferase [Escherichia coli]|nr:SAM-dependent methyltransferase [Escherichia coli]HEB0986879.1 SAM-dependent methyltransferase [Escherichia albertii]HEB0991389.1 SAM-dependent methyltransferase [Escherichia albertii]HEB0995952.1 SAM-dependent methyltransferase [Escherichia albertii]HEB1000532.1 SAM-dependent methyltransferase [Escherichia albertii]
MNDTILKGKIALFSKTLPFTKEPYSKKSWGHPLHSLCSYQGKLKPSLAYWLIKYFVPENGKILDPIGGVGTIALEGALNGRYSVTNDKSPFASIIANAKTSQINYNDFIIYFNEIKEKVAEVTLTKDEKHSVNFGLNARVKDYYHPKTLVELLKLRKILGTETIDDLTPNKAFFWASLLHILHGNRPYALSRNSHPITPFSPTGEFIYKNTFEKIQEKAFRALSAGYPNDFIPGKSYYGDFREIANKEVGGFDAIITSPPFYGMRFDRPNWLRLWFCGWEEHDFKEQSLGFLERQQTKNINVYYDFFDVCRKLISENGILILHLGKGGKKDMSEELKIISSDKFKYIDEITENVQRVANHGIKDKGLTIAHNLLFFTPK